MNEELEGLPEEVRDAATWLLAKYDRHGEDEDKHAANLLGRLARLCASVRGMSVCEAAANITSVMEYIKELESRAERAESELAEIKARIAASPVYVGGVPPDMRDPRNWQNIYGKRYCLLLLNDGESA